MLTGFGFLKRGHEIGCYFSPKAQRIVYSVKHGFVLRGKELNDAISQINVTEGNRRRSEH